jgi:hypothetical protein
MYLLFLFLSSDSLFFVLLFPSFPAFSLGECVYLLNILSLSSILLGDINYMQMISKFMALSSSHSINLNVPHTASWMILARLHRQIQYFQSQVHYSSHSASAASFIFSFLINNFNIHMVTQARNIATSSSILLCVPK